MYVLFVFLFGFNSATKLCLYIFSINCVKPRAYVVILLCIDRWFFFSICSPNGKERCECIKYAVGYFCQFGECIFFKMLYVDFGCKLFVFFSLFKKFLSLIKRKKTHRMTYLQMVSLSKKRKNGEKKRATDSLAYPGHSCVEYYERTTE